MLFTQTLCLFRNLNNLTPTATPTKTPTNLTQTYTTQPQCLLVFIVQNHWPQPRANGPQPM
ncbi:MAG: hypothetical protein EBZ62_05055 [Sphingobacteriia bacterium]|nr:hypothetical protein [Sphingobacteriia bacterium]